MKLDDLQQHVWRRLGPRKFLLGRKEVDLLTRLTVENWEAEYYTAAATDDERQIVADGTLVAVKRMYQAVGDYGDREYGFVWTWLLSAIASAIIQVILRWWLERRRNRVMMLIWQQESRQ